MKSRACLRLLTLSVLTWRVGLIAELPPDKSGVSPSAISLPSGPGSIEGLGESFEPQLNTGTSTYSVGFELPPGRAGLQPRLALTYNSGQGNSMVGIGWNFNLPSIKRQTDKGFPSYDSSDTFLFEGEELVPLTDGSWRCENESAFIRFQQIDTDGDGRVDAWEAAERNGIRHVYGSHRDSEGWSVVEHPEQPSGPEEHFNNTYCWALDTTIDLHGNRIEYHYNLGTGTLYPSSVLYTRHAALPENTPLHRVDFHYDLDRRDAFDDYRPTFSAKVDRLLTNVVVTTNDRLVRSYGLVYQDSSHREGEVFLGLSLLRRVVQYDNSGTDQNYLPPLLFDYYSLNENLADAKVQTLDFAEMPELELSQSDGNVQIVDVDADGLPDLFKTNMDFPQRQEVVLNLGVDEEGRLRFGEKQTVDPGFSPPDLALPTTTLSDFDGDGIVDFLHFYDEFPGKRMEVYPNRTRLDFRGERLGFEEPSQRFVYDDAPEFVGFGSRFVRQMDLNFDKSSDFLLISQEFPNAVAEGAYLRQDGHWELTSHRFDPTDFPSDLDFTNPGLRLADMNGDRLQDLVWIRKEGGFVSRLLVTYWPYCGPGVWGNTREIEASAGDSIQIETLPLEDVFVQDLSGDGLADLYYLEGNGSESTLTIRFNVAGLQWTEGLSKDGLPRYQPRASDSPTLLRSADLNGNGSVDLIWRNTTFSEDSWSWLDIAPGGQKPNLLSQIDNSIGKITEIEYGSAHEDYVRAQNAGSPWKTKIPFAVQVVRQIRIRCGHDLNGDGVNDSYVSSFKYRDGFYDGLEKEFRGFGFAERIDYGDDYLWDEKLGRMRLNPDWSQSKTPTGQVSGPSLVTRYRFHTGAADQLDNDESIGSDEPGWVDEWTVVGGREEEILKGKQLLEEKVDPAVLVAGEETDFDANCVRAESSGFDAAIAPDSYVYTRIRQRWGVRRLYRPSGELAMRVDLDADGELESLANRALRPAGRFSNPGVVTANGRSVSYAFVSSVESDVIEANGLLSEALGYEVRASKRTLSEFDFDDYGNGILELNHGIVGSEYDDERRVTTSYAHGGEALERWILDRPDVVTTTDENGAFVNRTIHYYDGEPFVGLSGQVQGRALLHRIEQFVDEAKTIDAERLRYDAFGNAVEMRDPNYDAEWGVPGGHSRQIAYDSDMWTYPVKETIAVGNGSEDLVVTAAYDLGFGTVTRSTDFNGNQTTYHYDSFSRLVKIVRPGDTETFPTLQFDYQPADPFRGVAYAYDSEGGLTLAAVPVGAASRVTTRQREDAGKEGVFVTATFSDGGGKALASLEEGEVGGTWIVKDAVSYNLRMAPMINWLPYQITHDGVPGFTDFWNSGRPPENDGVNPSIVGADLGYDPMGRQISALNAPETWGGTRTATATQLLPFEARLFDEEDLAPNSPHSETPHVQYQDGLGRLIAVDEVVRLTDEGLLGPIGTWRTEYQYDLNDQLVRIQDSQNNVKTITFDGLKRMIFMDDPDRGHMAFGYDAASNLRETVDAKSQKIVYTYDGVNRILTEDYQDGGPREHDVVYVYDSAVANLDLGDGTRGIGQKAKGRLAVVQDLSGETHFSFDDRARVEWEVKRIPDRIHGQLVSFRTGYEYDSLDRLRILIYPDGDRVVYSYNSRNLPSRIHGSLLGDVIGSIRYRPSGQMKAIRYGNQVDTTYAYDPRLRMVQLETVNQEDVDLVRFGYSFDGTSNILRIDDRRKLEGRLDAENRFNTQVFTYDSLYRLTRAEYPTMDGLGSKHIRYRYDRIGNMLSKTSDINHSDSSGNSIADLGEMFSGANAGRSNRIGRKNGDSPGPHALTSIRESDGRMRVYDYDRNGNMTLIDGLKCEWDFKDRLIAAENEKMRAEYVYDYSNRRVTKEVYWKDMLPFFEGSFSDINRELFANTATHYINKYFEVREYDSVVKYVWNGDTRISRITGTLGSETRFQHLRLFPGWNNVCLAIGGNFQALDPARNLNIESCVWLSRDGLVGVSADTLLPVGSILWVFSGKHCTLVLAGDGAKTSPRLVSRGGFVGNPFSISIDLASRLDSVALLSWFNPGIQLWHYSLPSTDLEQRRSSSVLQILPGQSFWVGSGLRGRELEVGNVDVRFYHQDHLRSSSVITDTRGNLIEEHAYYPYGAERWVLKLGKPANDYSFTQKEADRETNLNYFEARYLMKTLGRFASVDPMNKFPLGMVGDPQETYNYSYCRSNPIYYYDPTGESGKSFLALFFFVATWMEHIGPADPNTCRRNAETCGEPVKTETVLEVLPVGKVLSKAGKTGRKLSKVTTKVGDRVGKKVGKNVKNGVYKGLKKTSSLTKKQRKAVSRTVGKKLEVFVSDKVKKEIEGKLTSSSADGLNKAWDKITGTPTNDEILSLGKGPLTVEAYSEETRSQEEQQE